MKETGRGKEERERCQHLHTSPDLECMWGVVDAVDAKAVVQGEAGRAGGEQRQLQAFAGRLRRAGLAHQAVRSQLLHESVATLLLQLQVARRRQTLLSHRQHLLENIRMSQAAAYNDTLVIWCQGDDGSPPMPLGVSVSSV